MTFILFDIVQQFDIYEIIKEFKKNPYEAAKCGAFVIAYFSTVGGFVIPIKYSAYYGFKKLFFIILKYNLKEKFDKNHFAQYYGINFYIIALFVFYESVTAMVSSKLTLTVLLALLTLMFATFFFTVIMIAGHQEKFKRVEGSYIYGIPPLVIVVSGFIKFLSYCMRLLSLTLRLFINLAAGHLLLKAIVGLVSYFLFDKIKDILGVQFKIIEYIIHDINNIYFLQYINNPTFFFLICTYTHILRVLFYKLYCYPHQSIGLLKVLVLLLILAIIRFIEYIMVSSAIASYFIDIPWDQIAIFTGLLIIFVGLVVGCEYKERQDGKNHTDNKSGNVNQVSTSNSNPNKLTESQQAYIDELLPKDLNEFKQCRRGDDNRNSYYKNILNRSRNKNENEDEDEDD